jgi:hypothetical protein
MESSSWFEMGAKCGESGECGSHTQCQSVGLWVTDRGRPRSFYLATDLRVARDVRKSEKCYGDNVECRRNWTPGSLNPMNDEHAPTYLSEAESNFVFASLGHHLFDVNFHRVCFDVEQRTKIADPFLNLSRITTQYSPACHPNAASSSHSYTV